MTYPASARFKQHDIYFTNPNAGLLDGQLARRQHNGGHTDGPNWKHFIPWADKFLNHKPAGR